MLSKAENSMSSTIPTPKDDAPIGPRIIIQSKYFENYKIIFKIITRDHKFNLLNLFWISLYLFETNFWRQKGTYVIRQNDSHLVIISDRFSHNTYPNLIFFGVGFLTFLKHFLYLKILQAIFLRLAVSYNASIFFYFFSPLFCNGTSDWETDKWRWKLWQIRVGSRE